MWWDQHPEAGEIFDSNAGFTATSLGPCARPMPPSTCRAENALSPEQQEKLLAHICPPSVVELRSKTDSLRVLGQDGRVLNVAPCAGLAAFLR
jgi:Uma2 family endonuclease